MTVRQHACRILSVTPSDVFPSPRPSTCQSLGASGKIKFRRHQRQLICELAAPIHVVMMIMRQSWWIGFQLLLLSESIWRSKGFTANPSIKMARPWVRTSTTSGWLSSSAFLRSPLCASRNDDDDNTKSRSPVWKRLQGWIRNPKSSKLTITTTTTTTTKSSPTTPTTPARRILSTLARIKDLHNPITYLLIALCFALRVKWLIQNPYFLFAVAFCIKWYRARYVFKIPVWDRQPNWNNIITSREQEKDLKAFTCKKCGSTLFIAKTREFFFEGSTGIGGLGCFTCGAKGKENFVMDRDRIVEDVKEIDDYFEYERPLDFVSRAERRKLLHEAQGDEERANQLLVERANAAAGATTVTVETVATTKSPSGAAIDDRNDDMEVVETEQVTESTSLEDVQPEEQGSNLETETQEEEETSSRSSAPSSPQKSNSISSKSADDLDILDMDEF